MVKNVLIDTINIKKILVLIPDDGHVNRVPSLENFIKQLAGLIIKLICNTNYMPYFANQGPYNFIL